MKSYLGNITILLASALAACSAPQPPVATVCNPLPMALGDPFLLHASDGRYYMYGTSLADGFEAFVSDSLTNWQSLGKVYQGAQPDQWNADCFWAPEVYERDGRYYMFYSANERYNPTNEDENFKIGVAVSDSPAGPFTDLYNRPVFEADFPVIDANVFFDDESGKCYIYFSRCCYKHPVESEIADIARSQGICDSIEESWIYGAELKNDFSGLDSEPVLLLRPATSADDPQAEWESRSAMSGEAPRRWTEGSYTFCHNGKYYIMYSSNAFFGGNYAVGYATSDSPLGPFVKSENNPILKENASEGGKVTGTGHNMALKMPDGSLYTVYHGRMSDNPDRRVVLVDRMEITPEGELIVKGPTTQPQQITFR